MKCPNCGSELVFVSISGVGSTYRCRRIPCFKHWLIRELSEGDV